ncbi:MAG: TetR/AcrR family transcriptional regulator [Treponema sp.]|jgi:AcrR family transcriptional regulator|nr:TetR/AcrR family transcriptional regulator [Treponema sp.]
MGRKYSHENRYKIIKASFSLFLEHGYPNVTTRMIADACGIQRSLLHHYYQKKEQILLDVYLDICRAIYAYCLNALNREQFETLDVNIFFRIIYEVMQIRPVYKNIYMTIYRDATLLYKILSFAVDNNDFFGLPPFSQEKKRAVFMVCGSLSQLVLLYEAKAVEMSARDLINYAMHGYYFHLGFNKAKTQHFIDRVNEIITEKYVLGFIAYYEDKMFN